MARPSGTRALVARALSELRRRGLLLQSDRELPSIATLVAGEPVAGSWWSHPAANAIYWVLEDLEAEPRVLHAKLVNRKLTLVDRTLWPALFAVATAGEAWQLRGLSNAAKSLRARVRRARCVRTDRLSRWNASTSVAAAARELEGRLLVYASELHSETGKHVKRLETWEHLAERLKLSFELPAVPDARAVLEQHATGARFPWSGRT